MLNEPFRTLVELDEEVAGAGVDEVVEFLNVLPATDQLEDEPAVLAELMTIREQSEGAVPADELAADGNSRTTGVDGGTLVQQISRGLHRVQDDDDLAGDIGVDDIRVCANQASVIQVKKRCR